MIEAKDVDVFYGASQALRRVSLKAETGQVTCVLGRNGVGKTTLIRALVGQQPVRSGAIVYDAKDITAMPAYERARHGIAFVPQGREIFPLLTVEENLKSGFAAIPAAARKISDEIFELFPVLKNMLGRRGGDLSGGQQQQLAIARALIMQPKVLVLDEPTEGIQPSIIKDIERVIGLSARPRHHGDRAGRAVFRLRPAPRRQICGDGARTGGACRHAWGYGRKRGAPVSHRLTRSSRLAAGCRVSSPSALFPR